MKEKRTLLIDGNRGIYIPQYFARNFSAREWQLEHHAEDIKILLEGPEHEQYWDAWDDVLTAGTYVETRGKVKYIWNLEQIDGDLFAVNYD